jgi:Peptidase family M28
MTRRLRRTAIAALTACMAVAVARAQPPARRSLRAAADTIAAGDLLRDITYLASDELAGRGTPSPGQDLAAAYVEKALREAGIRPFGDNGTYRQHYIVTRATLRPQDTTLAIGKQTVAYGSGFVLTGFLKPALSSGGVVYVGTGIRSPKLKWDPYEGVDVRGKWLLVHGASMLPEGITREMLGAPGVDHMRPAQEARTRGALGLLIIPSDAALTTLDKVTPRPTSVRDLDPSVGWAYAQQPLPQLVLSKAALTALLEGESTTADAVLAADVSHRYGASFALNAAKPVTLRLAADAERIDAYNVAGIIDGADPRLKDEYLTISSHLDGAIGRATTGDTIYNAADDNASGSAGNMAIARAFALGPAPKRSIVLIWDTGEETGLWGSRHVAYGDIATHIVAHTCVDMIGRTKAPGTNVKGQEDLAGPGEVFVAGPGVLSTGMDRALARVASEFPYVKQNRKFDNAAESFFYPRTDAAPYFERRIPYVEFFTGLHEDYHRPSDDVSKIDPAKMEAIARTVYVFVSMLADDPVRPSMDKPLPANLVTLLAR